jgi:hypothetical protein
MFRPLALLTLLAAAPAPAQTAAPFTIGGAGYPTLQAAVDSVRMGSATITIAPGTYRQCIVQSGGRIIYRAATPGSVIFEATACEGKAAFVLRGQEAVVDGIVFRGIRVGDGNGAGIRIETGDLTVSNAMFLDSQEGILGGYPAASQRIAIDRSTFAGLGQCDETRDCAHSIYLATPGRVSVTNSRFERGRGGHYIKLRVAQVAITDNSFDDSQGSKTNYMIDLPEGATGLIAHNMMVQGAHKENHSALIVVAAEAKTYPSAGLRIEGNTASLAPGAVPTSFVADLSHQPLAIGANRLGTGLRAFEQR